MQGDAVRTMAFKKIEEKLMKEGINLSVLDNQELADIAVQFTGQAPPEHLPRETIIEILSQQENVQGWAQSIREKVGPDVTEAVKGKIRKSAKNVRAKAKNDPIAAQVTERFGVWLKESGYTSAQLTQMLDSNADGMITTEEAVNLIRTLTNSEPPEWAVNHVISAMDSNGDGQLSISEWWGFLESVGIEVNTNATDEFNDLEQELDNDKNTEDERALAIVNSEQEMAEALTEANKRAAERDAEAAKAPQEYTRYPGPRRIIRVTDGNQKEISLDGSFRVNDVQMGSGYWITNSRFVVQIADWGDVWWIGQLTGGGMLTICVDTESECLNAKPTDMETDWVPEEVETPLESATESIQHMSEVELLSDKNTTELAIEHLEKTRISSDAKSILEQCTENTCVIRVEEVIRTLIASDQYRRGCSIQGQIDGGPFSAEIMFPASENELVESFKQGSLVRCQAKIVKWSSGSRQASLEGRNPVIE
jgi:Ca2+-binding EF-hand superfamily protein